MGRIEIICGPMFSGKTEELMRRLNRAKIARTKFQLFKSQVDNRYSETEVVTHVGNKMECTPLTYCRDILELVEEDTKIVAIDEAQFFSLQFKNTVQSLVGAGKRVIIAGLDMDSDGHAFGHMGDVMSMAEQITKLTAVCESCGSDATHTLRVSNSQGQVLVGEHDHYKAVCRSHWTTNWPQKTNYQEKREAV